MTLKNILVLLGVILLTGFKAQSLYAGYLVNLGNLQISRENNFINQVCFPRLNNQACKPSIVPSFLITASKLSQNSLTPSERWALGRSALQSGDLELARQWLFPFKDSSLSDPLLYADLLTLYANLDLPDEVINLYEKFPNQPATSSLSPLIQLSYIEKASDAIQNGDTTEGQRIYHQLEGMQLGDLLVKYYFYQLAKELKDPKVSGFYKQVVQTPAMDIHWYQRSDWREAQINLIISLIDQGHWMPNSILGVGFQWEGSGNNQSARYLLEKALSKPWATQKIKLSLVELDFSTNTPPLSSLIDEVMNSKLASYDDIYSLGKIMEEAGRKQNSFNLLRQASAIYQRAYTLDPKKPYAVDRLVSLNMKLGNLNEANKWKSTLMQQVETEQPENNLSQEIGPGVKLLGYDILGESISWRKAVPVCIWWDLSKDQPGSPVDGTYRVNAHNWVVCSEVTNLAPNGGFEQDGSLSQVIPSGYPLNHYADVPLSYYSLVKDPSGIRNGTSLEILRDQEHPFTGLASDWIPIDPQKVYLYGGWIHAENGGAYLGYQLLPTGESGYAAYGLYKNWTQGSSVINPSANRSKGPADKLQLWLLNVYGAGRVYYDDIFLLEINAPE